MKVERIQGVAWRKVGEETVVIHLSRHRIFGLVGVAGLVWEALEEPRDVSALEAIASSSLPEGTDCAEAVRRFVCELAEEGLIDVDGDLPAAGNRENVVDFPRIEWREDLQQFAGMCHLVPGQSHQCNQHPGTS